MLLLLTALLAQETVPDAERERAAFQVAPEFSVNLYASEPWIANPVQMVFDADGRLWVICMQSFPQIEAGKLPSDTLVVLEDSDGDGRADRHTVFADDLYNPTGIELGDGGVYVANQPDLLFLKDTDGDGKADLRRILLSGFGTEDSHHAIGAFNWGPGGWLYMSSGIFLHTQVETPSGIVRSEAIAGVFELRPRSVELRHYVRALELTNPWSHVFDRWGQDLLLDASQNESLFYLAPARVGLVIPPGYPRIAVPRVTCGAVYASGAQVPDDLRGNLVVNNCTKKAVLRYRIEDEGSGFSVAEVQPPLIQSLGNSFRPVDVKMGPDGAIYVLDFSNLIVGHMTYNFRDPRRDHLHGRVWRITATGRPLLKPPLIKGARVQDLLKILKSPVDFERYKARRELAELRPADVAGALGEWLKELDPKDPEHEHHRLEALWLYQTIQVENRPLLCELLRSREPRARAAATRVLGYLAEGVENVLDLLEVQVADDHPRVRLEAIVAASRVPSLRSFLIVLLALERPMDRYIEAGLRLALLSLAPLWVPGAESGEIKHPRLAYALEAASVQSAPALLAQLRSGRVPDAERPRLLALIAESGSPDELLSLLDEAAPGKAALAALARSARERKIFPRGLGTQLYPTRLEEWLGGPDAVEAIRLAGAWKVKKLEPFLEEIARSEKWSLSIRRAALESLAEYGNSLLLQDLASNGPPQIRRVAVGALAEVDLETAARLAVGLLADGDPSDILSTFLSLKGGAEAIGGALKTTQLPPDSAKLGLRFLYASGRDALSLAEIFRQGARVGTRSRDLSDGGMKDIVSAVRERGDPVRGEAVFRRKENGCFNCHAIAGAGGQVGPDLSTVGSSSPVDYLVDSVLRPGRNVKENYVAITLVTKLGEVVTGTKVRETDKDIYLREATRGELKLPLSKMAEKSEGGSLMPEGLADLFTEQELLDLVSFLAQLGRPGAHAIADVPVVRRWRIMGDAPATSQQSPPGEEVVTWEKAYSEVSGILPARDLKAPQSWVEFQLDVTTPGRVGLCVQPRSGLQIWIDDVRVDTQELLHTPALSRGRHRVTFLVDLMVRGEAGLRCEIVRYPGLTGRAHPRGGS